MTEALTLSNWLQSVATELNCPVSGMSVDCLLDVARDVAHNKVRAGAPTSTFLIGYALAMWAQSQRDAGAEPTNTDLQSQLDSLCRRVQDLATADSTE